MFKLRDNKIFIYQAKNKDTIIKGEIVAPNISMAKTLARKQGLNIISIKPKGVSTISGGKVNASDVCVFSRQMATMQSSGISLVQGLNIIIDGAEKKSYRDLILGIREEVESGKSFSVALKKYPLIFDDLFCSLVAAGEQSGALDTMLSRIANYKEKTENLKNKIKKALYYPVAILVVAFIVSGLLLVKVVPTFKKLFEGFGSKLPAFTLMVLSLSDFVQKNGAMILASIAILVYLIIYFYKRNKIFKNLVQRLILKIPVIGTIIDKAAIARFARTLSTTFAAGVPLNEALVTVAQASGNIVYQEAINMIKEAISSGQNLQVSMQRTGMFPTMVVQMVSVGEESGKLEQMLDKVATIYEEEVNYKVEGLTALLEPLIMAILGVIVGGLIVAMYLPIFKMGSVM
jgi:type IV pilus assembly protein PilC